MVDEKWHNKEHLEEAAYGADLYGVDSLNGFHQEANDGEENCGQESIEQTKTWTSLWFLQVCERERKRRRVKITRSEVGRAGGLTSGITVPHFILKYIACFVVLMLIQ